MTPAECRGFLWGREVGRLNYVVRGGWALRRRSNTIAKVTGSRGSAFELCHLCELVRQRLIELEPNAGAGREGVPVVEVAPKDGIRNLHECAAGAG
jgi:hypothetical protein